MLSKRVKLEYLPFYQIPYGSYESGLEDFVFQGERRDLICKVLATLTVREEQVIKLRFGLKDGKEHTLEEVGRYLQLTRERIRQLEIKALLKMRHFSRKYLLRELL